VAGWLDAYQRLPEETRERVKYWLHLQRLIAQTLRIPWEKWIDQYIATAMQHPFDYGFMQATLPTMAEFSGLESGSFSEELDPSAALIARVPLRAKNNLGKLSPDLQDAISRMLEQNDTTSVALSPADVVQLQKIFLKEKAIAKLKKKDFRSLTLERDGDEMIISLEGGGEILRMNVLEFGATMSKALL
jgi:hypothetical protein